MRSLILIAIAMLFMSCEKEIITPESPPKDLQLWEFATMLDIDHIYAIQSYTDTTGKAVDFDTASDKDTKYIFEATFADKNGRGYNTTTETICFFHWAAYPHPYGWIVFEFVDFDLTPTYYRVTDYNIEQGYFTIQTGNRLITFKKTTL